MCLDTAKLGIGLGELNGFYPEPALAGAVAAGLLKEGVVILGTDILSK